MALHEAASYVPRHFVQREHITDLEVGAERRTCFLGLYAHDAAVCSTDAKKAEKRHTHCTGTCKETPRSGVWGQLCDFI